MVWYVCDVRVYGILCVSVCVSVNVCHVFSSLNSVRSGIFHRVCGFPLGGGGTCSVTNDTRGWQSDERKDGHYVIRSALIIRSQCTLIGSQCTLIGSQCWKPLELGQHFLDGTRMGWREHILCHVIMFEKRDEISFLVNSSFYRKIIRLRI